MESDHIVGVGKRGIGPHYSAFEDEELGILCDRKRVNHCGDLLVAHIRDLLFRAVRGLGADALAGKLGLRELTGVALPVDVSVEGHKMEVVRRVVIVDVECGKLVSEIAKAINGSHEYGLGELELYSVKRFAPVTDYQGKVMTFHAKEFNRPTPNNKPVPSNRKKG